MRLTLDMLQNSEQSINAAKLRQLTLRGQHLDALENLGVTRDQFECIDFSDNNLLKISAFPPMEKLKMLLFSNNHISRLADDCFGHCPNLESIVLTKNKLRHLSDLDPLSKLKNLERLTLRENDLCKHKFYKLYVVHMMRNTKLRILDFVRITDMDRKRAQMLFSGPEGAKRLAEIQESRELEKAKSNTTTNTAANTSTQFTVPQANIIKTLIQSASDLKRIDMLEKMYKSGEIPDVFFQLYPQHKHAFNAAGETGAPGPKPVDPAMMAKASSKASSKAPPPAAKATPAAVETAAAKAKPSPKVEPKSVAKAAVESKASPAAVPKDSLKASPTLSPKKSEKMDVDEEKTLEPIKEDETLVEATVPKSSPKAKAKTKAKASQAKSKAASEDEADKAKKTPKVKAKAKTKK